VHIIIINLIYMMRHVHLRLKVERESLEFTGFETAGDSGRVTEKSC